MWWEASIYHHIGVYCRTKFKYYIVRSNIWAGTLVLTENLWYRSRHHNDQFLVKRPSKVRLWPVFNETDSLLVDTSISFPTDRPYLAYHRKLWGRLALPSGHPSSWKPVSNSITMLFDSSCHPQKPSAVPLSRSLRYVSTGFVSTGRPSWALPQTNKLFFFVSGKKPK